MILHNTQLNVTAAPFCENFDGFSEAVAHAAMHSIFLASALHHLVDGIAWLLLCAFPVFPFLCLLLLWLLFFEVGFSFAFAFSFAAAFAF